jgi:hypothetical protein
MLGLIRRPAVFEEFVPCAYCGLTKFAVRKIAAAQFMFQHLAECWPHVRWDESDNVVGYPDAGT